MASGRDDLVIDVDDEIRERNYGELQGLDKKAFKNEHGPLTPETLKKFGAETDDELRVRIPAAILEQLYKPGRPMFVAHSGTAKALMLELLKHKEFVRPQNGEIWCFEEIEPDQWQATVNGEIHQDPTISRQEL
jgi:broad specificity phosphatase PhoE